MSLQSDYVDYDVFLDIKFDPIAFANTLVVATNAPNDAEVDLATPAKRLGYDLAEVKERIEKLTTDKYDALITEGVNVQEMSRALEPLKPAVENLTAAYGKLQRDIMAPFYQAQHIHGALRRLHATTGLLRSLTWFLYLVRQVSAIMDPLLTSDSSSSSSPSSAPRTARQANLFAIPDGRLLLRAAQTVISLHKQLSMEPALRSVQVIRTFESSLLGKYEARLTQHCQNIIRFYTLTSASTVPLPTSNSINVDDYDTLAAHAASALAILNPNALVGSLVRFVESQAQASVTELTRSLPSLNLSMQAFTNALGTIADRARFVGRYENALRHSISDDILSRAVGKFGDKAESLVGEYWADFADAAEQRLREFAGSNNNMATTIRFKNYPSSSTLVETYVIKPFNKSGDPLARTCKPDAISVRQLSRGLAILFK
ncbi:uncharacterized protein SAPINGB_P001240 [Magnusiomyces paraingens]|uniref:Conserved oligomeric Golgi complex subunit 5 N-terminal domain-containing protein n=1 Tax=Magnusiomyces paraingens TaxID=2606893 RepID=A0A5E8B4P4_9ASCO|nr:uncharacterized protein SAPINGB_P001240 [Saprochaete ingens]VVT46492.1 unnamed protein product [Saprochaete ingens]